MTTYPNALDDGSVLAAVTRISGLDVGGNIASGENVWVTNKPVSITWTPAKETGVDLTEINAAGDLVVAYKHGDMPKYWDVTVAFATPNPLLENVLAGGDLLTATGTVVAAPAFTATEHVGGGTLPIGTYYYYVTSCTQWGESLVGTEESATLASPGHITLAITPVTGAIYQRIYRGTASGNEQLIDQISGTAVTYDDSGYATPNGAQPSSDTTAGPGVVGVTASALFTVGNPNGVSIEFWTEAVYDGLPDAQLPWIWWVLPRVRNFLVDQREASASVLKSSFSGQGFENTNFNAGPMGDWPFPGESKAVMRTLCAATPVPVAMIPPYLATP